MHDGLWRKCPTAGGLDRGRIAALPSTGRHLRCEQRKLAEQMDGESLDNAPHSRKQLEAVAEDRIDPNKERSLAAQLDDLLGNGGERSREIVQCRARRENRTCRRTPLDEGKRLQTRGVFTSTSADIDDRLPDFKVLSCNLTSRVISMLSCSKDHLYRNLFQRGLSNYTLSIP